MAFWQLLLVVPPAAAGAAAFVKGLMADPRAKLWRKLRQAELTKIGDLEEGSVAKVRGKVEAFGPTLDVPLVEQTCVHYQVWGLTWDETAGAYGDTEVEARSVDFWVVDDTGRLLVRDGAFERVVDRERLELRRGQYATPAAIEARFGQDVQEAVIASIDVGEEIIVYGRIGKESVSVGPAGYREASGSFPSLVEDPEVGRLVSDSPHLVGAKR